MQKGNTISKQTVRVFSLITCAALFTVVTAASSPAAERDSLTPPPVPFEIHVDGDLFLIGHGVGTQNYVCLPSSTGFAFSLFTPEATLFTDDAGQLTTHFFSPDRDPRDFGAIRVTWEHSRDTSTIWGAVTGQATVSKDAINWLRVEIKGALPGPTGGDKLTPTTFVQRINTVGGLAPAADCVGATDVGKRAFVPYTADYLFFKSAEPQQ